jgi:hypothetical protein
MKRWKCSVFGYIHNGDEPPEKCPVCGADRSKFVLLEEDPSETIQAQSEPPKEDQTKSALPQTREVVLEAKNALEPYYKLITGLMVKYHAHPISVHIPNGVLPVSFLFLILAMGLNSAALDRTAFYNLIVVVLAMPVVAFAGYVDWKNVYGGNLTHLFLGKMICAGTVFLLSLMLCIWHGLDAGVALAESPSRFIYLLVYVLDLAAAVVAGLLGGKLVFPNRNRK